jgi:dienelactone hydrolase
VAVVEEFHEALAQNAIPTEIVRYPGAEHGFFAKPGEANETASHDSWHRMLAFLAERISGH